MTLQNGSRIGEGKLHHFKALIKELCPHFAFHFYTNMILDAWVNNDTIGLAGPAACVDGSTLIFNPMDGTEIPIEVLCRNKIRPTVMTLFGPMQAEVPFLKGGADLYEVQLQNGESFVATGEHRVLTESGFLEIDALQIGQRLLGYASSRPQSNLGISQSGLPANALHCSRKEQDFRSDYLSDRRFCDAQLRCGKDGGLCAVPSPACVRGHIYHERHSDALGTERRHTLDHLQCVHLSNSDCLSRIWNTGNVSKLHVLLGTTSHGDDSYGSCSQSGSKNLPHLTFSESTLSLACRRSACFAGCISLSKTEPDGSVGRFSVGTLSHNVHKFSCDYGSKVQPVPVQSIRFVRRGDFYDVHVPVANHYFAQGAIHHNTGKTHTCAMAAYAEFFCKPRGTTIIMSSITLPGLKLRVWGSMVDILKTVHDRRPDAPGYLVPSEVRIYPQEPTDEEKNSPKDAIIGVACKQGDTWIGIGPYVGIHNDYVIGVFDESSLMPGGFWDAVSNLRKSARVKFAALGNPKDYYDALGKICEPAVELGGWEGLSHSEHSRTWKTRGTNGIAVQLSGLDTPNGTGADGTPSPGLNRFPYLITPEQIEEDRLRYGADSWQFQMMDLGVWPKGESSKRVITRAICESGNAFGEPLWDGVTPTTDYVGLDAAYSGVGGDRSPLIRCQTGRDINGTWVFAVVDGPIIIPVNMNLRDDNDKPIPAEVQIAVYTRDYCQKNNVPASRLGYDSTGRGSLAAAFARAWNPHTVGIEFGGLPLEDRRVLAHDEKTEREEYGKNVSALWFAWRNLISMGQMRKLPTSVFEEGTMREFYVSPGGKTDVEPKEKTIKRMGRSPDLADGLVVCLEVARRNGFQIGKDVKSKSSSAPKWLSNRSESWRESVGRDVLV